MSANHNSIISLISTIILDGLKENVTTNFFNLNPDDYKSFIVECNKIMNPPKEIIVGDISIQSIMICGVKVSIDCRGWENKWGAWYFENDVNIMVNDQTYKQNTIYYWKDIMFHSTEMK